MTDTAAATMYSTRYFKVLPSMEKLEKSIFLHII